MQRVQVRKSLSPNDVGDTLSHQAGIVVPKGFVQFFPPLSELAMNPSVWLSVQDELGRDYRWRYIYYNNRLFDAGTRNEYRLTHTTTFLRDHGARAGDTLVFERVADAEFRVIVARDPMPEAIVLSTSGRWVAVAMR